MASGILSTIVDRKRREVAAALSSIHGIHGLDDLRASARAAPAPRDFRAALRRDGAPLPRVIAEFKRRSPSAGAIRPGADPAAIAGAYAAAGAAALSILTDGPDFDGALEHLAAARAVVPLPLLRKDFVVHELQIVEARAAGADAVLLIAAILDDPTLAALAAAAARLGLAALVEIHDAGELERALAAGATIVGVNARNLDTLEIDRSLFAKLRPKIPEGVVAVAESGIRDAADVRALGAAGADAILVGDSLMRAASPGDALRQLL